MLCSFLYSLTYCTKEVIKGKILWILNEKVLAYEAATAWNRGIPCNFSKHWSNCICFVYFSIFDLLYQRGHQRQYFWTLYLKVLAYEAVTAWNRGIRCKILIFLIRLYLVLLNGSKRLSEVRFFNIIWICRPIRQIHPETGESLAFFQNTNPIIFVTFISLFFDLLYQRGYQK